MQRRQFIVAAAAGLAIPSLVRAADIAGPVRIVVGFAPGGGTDVLARVIGQKLGVMWNTSVLVENKPGATGAIAAAYVAKQPPDGTTLLMAHVNSHAIAPALLDVKYDPRTDFTPISMVGVTPNMLTCRPEQKVRSVSDIVALCRQKPGKISFGSSGIGSAQHLALEMFRLQARLDVVHVPYKGSGPLVADLIGGQIDYAFDTMTAATPFIQQGKVIAIAQTRLKRAASHPNVPTLAESGFPGLDAASWYGLVGPKNMPPALVQRMNADVNRVLAMPDVAERLKSFGAEDSGGSNQQFAAFIASESTKWAKVVKDAGVKAES
ncbi:Tripartite-type tricarboxylate transporter, extracytoplasmic receptor component TctC [Cupriavidus necator]|uniref:Probable extra-cytoplasmic solute receptor n=1 Tax=Cupriavidus necator (strain ATCC 17699 / DSM 428 / KCTC 22496 / NCIMB 10442 / H16 / Stanier 337) TaxID=381666 RepID=Q0K6U3_CUPNH|nr:tripartite tricarboxylate transporter substrate binding protein [Cupriavidus necator]QCC02038.1 tripartite tricarboxylate transporter substrate binding protein [Cupriavidus necator H16]QQB75131.1 tripartite tricarboxylate transporter substrate binding protein [Cupriavidus necator]WKA40440.1 tripartite tricarboxylate transporter substrate binding protein [Cupriavidus necator]CAJ94278.1 probable extra-cytoplasmic solute receptor [Cupriavidus necator H16]